MKNKIIKLIIISMLFFYLYYIELNLPIIFFIIIEILLILKFFLNRKIIEKRILKHFTKYNKLKNWQKKIIVFVIYIAIFLIIKFLIIDIISEGIFDLNLKEQIYKKLNYTQN